jgi:hypothetical protein
MRKLALVLSGLVSVFAGALMEGCKGEECSIGAEACPCTGGGGCDLGLVCLSGVCVNAGPDELGDNNDEADESTSSGNTTNTTNTSDPSTSDTTDTGPKLDTLVEEETTSDQPCVDTGCKKVDMLFALDGSLSMIEEINALKAGQAFLGIVDALESLNCGGIDYRIGVTGDNDDGFMVPNNWAEPEPWFDSGAFTAAEISVHFQAAATKIGNGGGAPLGCEHVLTSAVNLLGNDSTGFLREDALLVLVMVTDVDDYGAYDQQGGNSCGLGCPDAGPPVQTLYDTLVSLKADDPAGVATIVIAGDPTSNAGVNICNQPQSCQTAFHADRLYEFASLHAGTNGFTADVCDGAGAVPQAVQTALGENIDLACQEFEPVG